MSRLLPGNAEPPRTDTHTQRTIHENITVTHMPAHRTQKTESRPQTPQAQEHRHSSCCRSSTHIRFRCRVQGRLPHPLAQAAAANHPLPNDGSVHYGAWESAHSSAQSQDHSTPLQPFHAAKDTMRKRGQHGDPNPSQPSRSLGSDEDSVTNHNTVTATGIYVRVGARACG